MAAALISSIIAASASGSKQRTGDSSIRAEVGGRRAGSCDLDDDRAHLDTWESTDDAEVGRAAPWPGAGRHPGRRLPGRGPLEHVAGVGEAVLLHAGQVGVAGPGLGQGLLRLARGRATSPRSHLRPLGVADLDGHRRAERAAVADAAEERQLVLLEAHPGPAAEAEPAPGQLGLDLLDGDRQPGGQALDDDDEGPAVGLAGGQEAEHGPNLPGAGTADPWRSGGGSDGRIRVPSDCRATTSGEPAPVAAPHEEVSR